ncbi:amino acid ABC transporter substrate-binding protein, partial [Pseudomonas syringae pv. tagetis]
VSALFDPHDTPHARSFMRALAVARICVPGLARVQWHFLDDGAYAVRGAEVARQMIDWKGDLVIGLFSSYAGVRAAALYL